MKFAPLPQFPSATHQKSTGQLMYPKIADKARATRGTKLALRAPKRLDGRQTSDENRGRFRRITLRTCSLKISGAWVFRWRDHRKSATGTPPLCHRRRSDRFQRTQSCMDGHHCARWPILSALSSASERLPINLARFWPLECLIGPECTSEGRVSVHDGMDARVWMICMWSTLLATAGFLSILLLDRRSARLSPSHDGAHSERWPALGSEDRKGHSRIVGALLLPTPCDTMPSEHGVTCPQTIAQPRMRQRGVAARSDMSVYQTWPPAIPEDFRRRTARRQERKLTLQTTEEFDEWSRIGTPPPLTQACSLTVW